MERLRRTVMGTALVLAAVWSIALMALALVAPVYSGETGSATMAEDGTVTTSATSSTATMVQVNGAYVLVLLAIPLVITGLVALLLRFRGRPAALIGAWVLTGLLGAFCVLGLMSIGLFIVPVVLGLVVACTASMWTAPSLEPLPEAFATPNP
jgi:hypothetical protein